MRTTIKVDSATPAEVYHLTLAFQRTSKFFGIPAQVTKDPTVTVGGVAMGWESPALHPEHVLDLLAEFHRLEADEPTVYVGVTR